MSNRHHSDEDYRCARRNLILILAALAIGIAASMFCGCTATKYVPIETTHTEHHWHTDSVHQHDSTYHEKTTTIMQLDSAAMAAYGIQLKHAERAWLVKTQELEQQIQRMMQLKATADTVRDTISVPVVVEKPLSAWQKTRMKCGSVLLILAGILVIYLVIRIALKYLI